MSELFPYVPHGMDKVLEELEHEYKVDCTDPKELNDKELTEAINRLTNQLIKDQDIAERKHSA